MKDELKYQKELDEAESSTKNLFLIEKAARQQVNLQKVSFYVYIACYFDSS